MRRVLLSMVFLAVGAAHGANIAPAGIVQIQTIYEVKRNLSEIQKKIDLSLLLAARQASGAYITPASQNLTLTALFIASNVAADQTILLDLKATVSDELVAYLKGLGGRDIVAVPRYDSIRIRLPLNVVETVAARPDVRRIGPAEIGETNRIEPPASSPSGGAPLQPMAGSLVAQSVATHQADLVHASGIDGTGVTIGVLSDGVASLVASQTSGNLPAGVVVLAGQAGTGDEGTAMLEIVHDMAPGATLCFASAFASAAAFAQNILDLRDPSKGCGADIIVDDVTYYNEGAFQDSSIAQAVTQVTTDGALFFTSSANSGHLTRDESGTWEGDFAASVNSNGVIDGYEGGSVTLHDFDTGVEYNALTARTYNVSLKWSDPLGHSANDYDLFVMNSAMNTILGVSASTQDGIGNDDDPYERAYLDTRFQAGDRIVVALYSGAARALRVDSHRGRLTYGTEGSAFGHNASATAYSVGAVDASNPANLTGGVFSTGALVESFSSDGRRRMFFNPDGTEITPGNILFATNGGTLLDKVDIAAADGVATTAPGFNPFYGTSAAAPNAGAIAALVMAAKSGQTPAQIRTALTSTALDIEAAGWDRDSGDGLVMAAAAVRSVLSALGASMSFSPTVIVANASSILSITLSNDNDVALTGVTFDDSYPTGLVNAATPAGAITGSGCSGTVTASAGGTSLGLADGTIPAHGSCVVTVAVTSADSGVYSNSSGTIGSPVGLDTSAVSAALEVNLGTVVTGPGPYHGGDPISASLSGPAGCAFDSFQFVPNSSVPYHDGYVHPFGLFDFTTNNHCGGGAVTLTVTYPSLPRAYAQYWKYGPTPGNPSDHWYTVPSTILGNSMTFTLTDGLAGDDDRTANGIIVDAGGPGFPVQAIPALHPLALFGLSGLLALLAGVGLRRRVG